MWNPQATVWMQEPEGWTEMMFGAGFYALPDQIRREIGPEYEMHETRMHREDTDEFS